jgi:regulatory protein
MTQKEALEKMAKYCAYQERCQFEVRTKLFGSGLSDDEIENIICDLIEQNFLDELRFSKAFVRGKFNAKSWGKIKIRQHLKQKRISDFCIRKGLLEISSEEYYIKLDFLLQKKKKLLSAEDEFTKKQKLARYLIGKGFESEMVWEELS